MPFYPFIAIAFYLDIVRKNIVCELGPRKEQDKFATKFLLEDIIFGNLCFSSKRCVSLCCDRAFQPFIFIEHFSEEPHLPQLAI